MRNDTIKKIGFFISLAVFLCLPCGHAAAESPQDILIIVNKSVSQRSITLSELKNFFLKEKTTWSSGDQVVPIHAPTGTSIRRAFTAQVLGMQIEDEKIFWQESKIKTGKARPVEFSDTAKAVFKLRGSISYIYRSQYKEGVFKVIMELPAGGGSSE